MPKRLSIHPVHLGRNAVIQSEPEYTGVEWYAAYGMRHASDGNEGRLVSTHRFTEPWNSWKMHAEGHELVLCLEGEMTLIQEIDGQERRMQLRPGEYAINDPGVWHTADANEPVSALLITAGMGTQIREREA